MLLRRCSSQCSLRHQRRFFGDERHFIMARCHRKEQYYHGCGHTQYEYTYCNGNHTNDYASNAACNSTPGIPPGTTERPPGLPGYCSPFCIAKARGWYCCQCTTTDGEGGARKQYVRGYLMGSSDSLVHDAHGLSHHIFCGNCTAAVFTLLMRLIE